jgi:hypothetical protein
MVFVARKATFRLVRLNKLVIRLIKGIKCVKVTYFYVSQFLLVVVVFVFGFFSCLLILF